MLKKFRELSFFEKTIFLVFKPIFVIAFLSIGLEEVKESEDNLSVYLYIMFCVLVVISIYLIELKIASTTFCYKSSGDNNLEKILEVSSRYLSIDFTKVKAYRKSMRGELSHRGFTEKFRIAERNSRLYVNLHGDFPFPASVLNWFNSHSKIERELRSHRFYRT